MSDKSDKRAVIFDWGGVLMRTEDHGPRNTWDNQLGLEIGSVERTVHGIEEWTRAQQGEISLAAYWQAVGQKLGLTPKQLRQLQGDFYAGDRLDPDLLSLIRELREAQVAVGLLSNNSPDLADTLADLEVAPLFTAIVISASIGIMKPDPAAYHAILEALEIAPEQAVFVDDSMDNVEGARAVGMASIHFTPGMDLRSELLDWLNEGS
jgi:putative hydrolase of the HAD superfamily